MKFIVIFLALFANRILSQDLNYHNEVKMKVKLSNFHLSPPYCGTVITASIYKATIKDFNKVEYGSEILFFVICKAEKYPQNEFYENNEVYITVSDDSSELSNVALINNFTFYKDDEIKKEKIYKLVSIDRRLFKL